MKIDKTRPSHWIYLALTGVMVLLALAVRLMPRGPGRPTIVLYGHKLGGNLLAIYRALQSEGKEEVIFLTMDPAYHRELRKSGESSCLSSTFGCALLLGRASALVSDHGLHVLQLLLGRTRIRFFDVWHGIPFKGFDADDFRVQHRYHEAWVASPLHRSLYVDRFGFDAARVHVTGYARTDALVAGGRDPGRILRELGIQKFSGKRFVLFAPTWKQDSKSRSIYPFDREESEFLRELAAVCRESGAVLLVRKHLNSGRDASVSEPDVVFLPYATFPDTESILLVCDMLICDWSSIAFDFMLLERPTIFLDVEPPFRKGYSLGPEYRFGAVVGDMESMLKKVDRYLKHPETFDAEHGQTSRRMREVIYGKFADGGSSERCVTRLRSWL